MRENFSRAAIPGIALLCTIFAYAAWAVAQTSGDSAGGKTHKSPNTIGGQPVIIHNLKIAVMDLDGVILGDSTVVAQGPGGMTKAEVLSDGMHFVQCGGYKAKLQVSHPVLGDAVVGLTIPFDSSPERDLLVNVRYIAPGVVTLWLGGGSLTGAVFTKPILPVTFGGAGEGAGNNLCAARVPIADGLHAFSTLGATTDGPVEVACQFDGQTYNDTWFIYEATCTGNLEVSTCNTVDYDTDLVVYDGTDCNNLTTLGCNDDTAGCAGFTSMVTVPVVGGNSYLIRVGGFNDGDVGSGDLSLICTGGVSNDDCADRTAISGTGVFDFDNTAASTDGAPDALCDEFGVSQIDNDVWFTWTAPCNGDFVVETCDLTTIDTKIAIYDGADCATSSILDCNDDTCGLRSQVTGTGLIAGQSYLIRIGTFPGAAGGPGQFSITGPDVGGTNYCEGALNGDGQNGAISMSGSASVAANDLVLVASELADVSFAGLFVMGDTQAMVPFASGFLCIDLGGAFFRLNPIINGGGDVISRTVDNTAAPANAITPGSTWYFQYWYRDLPIAGTNLTDGICICFAP